MLFLYTVLCVPSILCKSTWVIIFSCIGYLYVGLLLSYHTFMSCRGLILFRDTISVKFNYQAEMFCITILCIGYFPCVLLQEKWNEIITSQYFIHDDEVWENSISTAMLTYTI